MSFISTSTNLIFSVILIIKYLILGFINKRRIKDEVRWRRNAVHFVSQETQKLLKKANFEVQYNFSRPDLFSKDKNYFMVCNHMSYLDIVCLSAGQPAVFVTSVEMQNTPFLGEMSSYGGSYFVERRDRSKVPHEIKELTSLLNQGFTILVFPEATSTNGMKIIPFKRALFSAAIDAKIEVLPVCLRYEEINGEPFQYSNHDKVCWYDNMGFAGHFLKLMAVRSLKISVNYLEPISTEKISDRYTLADLAYTQISQKYFEGRESLKAQHQNN